MGGKTEQRIIVEGGNLDRMLKGRGVKASGREKDVRKRIRSIKSVLNNICC